MPETMPPIEAIIDDRFSRWRKRLLEVQATPLLMLSINPPRSELVVTTLEEMSDERVEDLLKSALILLDRQRRDRRPRR